MKKILLIISIIVFSLANVQAQQDIMISQYMFNGLFLNPAYAGSHQFANVSGLYRKQWVSTAGAPTTILLGADIPFHRQNMGAGLIISHDRIGVTNATDVSLNYSYHLKLGPGKLAFGIKGGLTHFQEQLQNIDAQDLNDPLYANGQESMVVPKFGFGAYYYFSRGYVGASIPKLLHIDVSQSRSSELKRHYYLYGGYVFDFDNSNVKVKPSALLKFHPHAPVEVDLNVQVWPHEMVGLGLGYRTLDGIVAMLQFQFLPNARLGYAFDYPFTDVKDFTSGSHEIMLGIDFGKDLSYKTPRYF